MRTFSIHVGGHLENIDAEFITQRGHNIYFWVSKGWWRRKRCVGIVDYRYVVLIESQRPAKSDRQILAEIGVRL